VCTEMVLNNEASPGPNSVDEPLAGGGKRVSVC